MVKCIKRRQLFFWKHSIRHARCRARVRRSINCRWSRRADSGRLKVGAARQIAGRLVALLHIGRSPRLFHEAQLARFVAEGRQEGGSALQAGVDAMRARMASLSGSRHCARQRRGAWRVAHDLRELKVGEHGGLLGVRLSSGGSAHASPVRLATHPLHGGERDRTPPDQRLSFARN
ncbi:hypothetical protein [Ottowia sp.]|uniref:hypothetical protein n=1 Tax=Ottowia sp. TaxID=1898956 RepID=UPI0039E606F8